MKKILMPLLFLLCANAWAENWTFVIASDNQEIKVDTNSIIRSGKYTRAWSIFNYSISARAPGTRFDFISDKSLFFFDCGKKRYGRTTQILYKEADARGESLMTYSGRLSDTKFEKVVPGTIGENFFSFVCSYEIR